MPPSFTVISGSDRVDIHPERSRTSSGGSASRHSPTSSGASRSYSGSGGSESWTDLGRPYEDEDDGIDPSDSASRSRRPALRVRTTEPRPEPTRRHSSRRIIEREEPPPRHRSSRSHHSSRHRRVDSRRVPSDESSSTVASQDEYYSHHGMPPPSGYPPSGYRHVPPRSHGGYPPSIMTSAGGYADPFAAQALVHLPQQDPFGYPSSANPFSPGGPQQNPFSPMGSTASTSYFATEPHAPPMAHHHRPPAAPRPQSFVAPSSHYGSEVMSPYGHPGMPPYGGYGMPPAMPGYPHMPGWPYPPPSNHSSPAPPPAADEKKADKKNEELESLKALIQKHEEARLAREKELIAEKAAEAAAKEREKTRQEEEKKKKEEIAAASKQAKEDAEKKAAEAAKKAKEEHEKKLKEAHDAKVEAEKKQKELEEQAAKLKPSPDAGKQIRFKDACGRKFSFPFHLCKTWKGMENLIKQAFLHIDVIGEHVHQGHYDLMGPDGEIILPQVWDTMIQPDWEVSMHMWPMPEEQEEEKKRSKKDRLAADAAALADPFAALGLGDLGIVDPGKNKVKKSGSKSKKNRDLPPMPGGPGMIPPPPNFPPGILPDPLMAGIYPPGISPVDDKRDKNRPRAKSSKSSKEVTGMAAWFAGASAPRGSKKDDEKLDLVKHKSKSASIHSADPDSCSVM